MVKDDLSTPGTAEAVAGARDAGGPPAPPSGPQRQTLLERLDAWVAAQDKGRVSLRPDDDLDWACEAAKLAGPPWLVGYGRTTNEAINNFADGLIEEGWGDDRGDAR